MTAIEITGLKYFMNLFLMKETFDSFLLEEASIKTGQTYLIDGHINKEFYTKEEWENMSSDEKQFTSFAQVRPICYALIKGTHTPLSMKFVLHAGESYVQNLLQKHQLQMDESNLKALLLTFRYHNNQAVITSGTAYHTFVIDRTIDTIWDHEFKTSFQKLGIPFEELT